jgi:hypothetical protein
LAKRKRPPRSTMTAFAEFCSVADAVPCPTMLRILSATLATVKHRIPWAYIFRGVLTLAFPMNRGVQFALPVVCSVGWELVAKPSRITLEMTLPFRSNRNRNIYK